MLRKEQVATIVSIAVVSFLIGTSMATDGGNPFDQIWEAILNLQERVETVESSSARKTAYTGTIDIEAEGDFVHEYKRWTGYHWDIWRYHWTEIPIPEITLEDMATVKVYVRPFEQGLKPPDTWIDADARAHAMPRGAPPEVDVVYDEGKVLILYKTEHGSDSGPFYQLYHTTGDYKITVIY